MMRKLGVLIVLSAVALAQTQTAKPTPAQPNTISMKPASVQPAQPAKTSTPGAKTAIPGAPKVSVSGGAKVSAAGTAPKAMVSVQKPPAKTAASSPSTNPKQVPTVKTDAKPAVAVGPKVASKPATAVGKASAPTVKPTIAHVELKQPKSAIAKPVSKVHIKVARAKTAVATVAAVKPSAAVSDEKATENKPKEFHTAGWRDPFVSPVVAMGAATGSGCSSGKRCLTIDQIALKGIVKSEAGMIAVVVNALDKAYFLRENDPVFNGYVVKITGDSVIFKETFHDRLGKAMTRDVTKSITRPVA